MKEISQEKFKQMLRRVRMHFGIMYYGASNNMVMSVKVNNKIKQPQDLTDEELVLLWQLCHAAENNLAMEQIKRDLLPDELKKLYEQAPTKPTSPIDNEHQGS